MHQDFDGRIRKKHRTIESASASVKFLIDTMMKEIDPAGEKYYICLCIEMNHYYKHSLDFSDQQDFDARIKKMILKSKLLAASSNATTSIDSLIEEIKSAVTEKHEFNNGSGSYLVVILVKFGLLVFLYLEQNQQLSKQIGCQKLRASDRILIEEVKPLVREKNGYEYPDKSKLISLSRNFGTIKILMQ